MLDIKKLVELKESLNLKHICDEAGLNYSTITKKIYSHKRNPNNGELSVVDSQKLLNALNKCNLQYLDN